MTSPAGTDRPRVVVVGAGFAGLWAARRLDDADVYVVVVDRHNFHTFYPLLYQIGAAEIDATEICYPVRKIFRGQENASFRMAAIEEVDWENRTISDGGGRLGYDQLILATGSNPAFYGTPGAEEHAYPLREVSHGLDLRNEVLRQFERAEGGGGEPIPGFLDFTIVGGGPTGVEYAGALAELVEGPIQKDYPAVRDRGVSITLLEGQGQLLPSLPAELGEYARRRLAEMGVEVRLNTMVDRVDAVGVDLAGGGRRDSQTVVWTAGVQGSPEAEEWGLPVARDGRVQVETTLQVPNRPEVQVAGDLARYTEDGDPLPMIAPVAMQQGTHAAENVLRNLRGEPARAFAYEDPGMLATIGRNHAIADLGRIQLTGFPAWLIWVVVHIAKLIGFRNRLVVLVNWAWDYVTYERFSRLILPDRDEDS